MQRQRSILSFFNKPSHPNSGSSNNDALQFRPPPQIPPSQPSQNHQIPPCSDEIRGTDTPPEKLRRPVFPGRFPAVGSNDRVAQPFSIIMHKFVRPEKSQSVNKESQGNMDSFGCDVQANKIAGVKEALEHKTCSSDRPSPFSPRLSDRCNGVNPILLDFDLDYDALKPETPLMQPFVPRLKRIKDDCHDICDKHGSLLMESSKRMKTLLEPWPVERSENTLKDLSETSNSKFEWLKPSSIRDSNRRRPDDPLYDKRTLYIPHDALSKMSATQRQYWNVKRQYMDVVFFFKVGKFYELYELDAEIGHRELDWKMTHSGVGKCRQVGTPESRIDDTVQKLIALGYKVGRMEQTETADQAKLRGRTAVVQRKLIHVYTPSTAESIMGPYAVHLLALKEGNWKAENNSTMYGFAFLDFAALKFWVGSICDDASYAALGALLVQVSPKEVVYGTGSLSKETLKALKKYAPAGSSSMQLTSIPGMEFLDASEVMNLVNSKGYFRESPNFWASAIDCQEQFDLAICALGGLIDYLSRLKLDDALYNGDLLPYHVYKSCLKMDGQSLFNLEIFSNNVDGGSSGTLCKHLDHCITSSGKRLLRKWICHPLKNVEEINDRLNVVEGLIKNQGISSVIAEYLHTLPDLERLLGRVRASVGSTVSVLLPTVGDRVLKKQVKSFGSLLKGLHAGLDLLRLIEKEDHESLPFLKVLNLPMLSELDKFLSQFEVAMQEDFPQYQDHDVGDSDAETLSQQVENFIGKVAEWSQVIQALSCVDVLHSFALASSLSGGSMCRPVILPADSCHGNSGSILKIKGLWHPYAVSEAGGSVVPNDIHLGEDSTGCHPRTLLLTGPNMGGKSTLLRATCLAVILAQLGCFVPCDSCVLSTVDIIFTRLGAMDRIMSGESTFFIECAEAASVLQNATKDSLVLLDELGRGTSTFDGYAIAYAVFRHLVENVHCRLLFATHYHPLTKEFASHPDVSLQHMACAFNKKTRSDNREKDLVFLYRLTPGACPESYGLQVALMAGIPRQVVNAAMKAAERMKVTVGENFKSSEGRSMFSTLHEECMKSLLAVSKIDSGCMDEDGYDTLLCLWHELRRLYGPRKS